MEISNKTILITGAKRIGKTVGLHLAKKRANLAIAYNSSKEEAEELASEAQKFNANAEIFQVNLSNEEEIKNLVSKVIEKFGKIHGLVHMASPYPATPLGKINLKDFDQIMRDIAGSALLLGQEVGLQMKKQGEGKIIFFSDWSVLRKPSRDYIVYNAAKAAVESIAKTLAFELAPIVSVNAIAPGPILRPEGLTEQEDSDVIRQTPLKKWGGPDEIAKGVLFLLESEFTTGVVLPIDGGRSIT